MPDVDYIKKVLKKANQLESEGDVGIAKEFISISEGVDEIKSDIKKIEKGVIEKLDEMSSELKKKLESELVLEIDREELRGEDGEDGIDGVDGETPTNEQLVSLIKPLIPNPVKGDKGDDGKDAVLDLEAISKTVASIIDFEKFDITKNIFNIRDSFESLTGDDRLDKSAINGLDDYDEIVKLAKEPRQIINKYSGGGASLFSMLNDVSISSPTNGQVPVYNSTTGKWENGTVTSGVTGATDTTLTLTGTTLGLNLANANTWTGQQTFNTSATVHGVGVITPKIYPVANGTNAVGVYKADGTTQIMYVDTTNSRIGIGASPTAYSFELRSSGNIQAWIGTEASSFGYTIGRNTSTGFLDILGNQGGFSGIHVNQIKSDGDIFVGANLVIRNWSSTLGIGNGSGTPNGTIEIRSSSNVTPNLSMGGGATSNYNFRRNTATGYLEIAGVQGAYTGYLFSTGNYTNVFTVIDGVGAVFNETGESVLDFRVESDTDANNFFVDASANANGFGTNAPSAKVHIIKTTEQLRVGYDASNYLSLTVGSTGGVTFDAVGSGAGFTFSDSVNITSSLQCDSIVNDTGLASGTYTPTLTGVANVTSSTARQATYMRVGNTVTVAGQIDVTPTANNTETTIGISLPIASAFTTAYQCGGSGHTVPNVGAGHGVAIQADATNDRAEMDYYETHGALDTITYQFSYQVL